MSRITSKENKGILSSFFGAGAAILISLGSISAMAQLLLSQKIGEGSIELFITVLLLLSSLLGNWISTQLNPLRALPAAAITTAAIMCVILIAGLTMDGEFHYAWLRMGAVAAGGLISCGLSLKRTGKRTRRKRRYR